jgi:hypothetical protein
LCLGSTEGEEVIMEEEAQGSVVEEEDRLRLRYLHETEFPTCTWSPMGLDDTYCTFRIGCCTDSDKLK